MGNQKIDVEAIEARNKIEKEEVEIDRSDRELESRMSMDREESWRPPSLLPDPPKVPGMTYRWVRSAIRGRDDSVNLSRARRAGYEFVPKTKEILDQMKIVCDIKTQYPDAIETAGMILMYRPEKLSLRIQSAIEEKAANQIQAVDNSLMKLNDSRMPLFSERSTRITYGGKGRG